MENRYNRFDSLGQQLCYDIVSHATVNGIGPDTPEIAAILADITPHVHRANEDPGYVKQLLRLFNPMNYVQTDHGYPYITAADKETKQPGSWDETPLKPITVVRKLVPQIRQDATSLTIGEAGLTVYRPNGTLIQIGDMEIDPDRVTRTELGVIDSFVFELTGLSPQLTRYYETERLRMRQEPDGSWTVTDHKQKLHFATN